MTAFSPIDRTLGFLFGLARGVFLVCVAYLVVVMALPQEADWPPWLRDAKSRPYLNQGAEMLRRFLPESLKLKSAETAPAPVDPAVEAKRAMGALATASAPGPARPETPPRYRGQNQRELDRLIDTQR